MRPFTALFLLLGNLGAAAAVDTGGQVGGFELEDQHGRRHQVEFPKARVTVLTLADRAGSDQLEGWVRPLYERYRDAIDIHGVAKLAGVPTPLRPMLRALFRKGVDYPVMMDWTGEVSTNCNVEARVANLMVICPAGRVDYRFNGPASPEELRRCFARIDALLSRPGPRAE
jgi:hypothetical protein